MPTTWHRRRISRRAPPDRAGRRPGRGRLLGEQLKAQDLAAPVAVHRGADVRPDRDDRPSSRQRTGSASSQSAGTAPRRAAGDGNLRPRHRAPPRARRCPRCPAPGEDRRRVASRRPPRAPARSRSPTRARRGGARAATPDSTSLCAAWDLQIDRAGTDAQRRARWPLRRLVRCVLRVRYGGPASASTSALMSCSPKVRTRSRTRSGSPSSSCLRSQASGSIVGSAATVVLLCGSCKFREDGMVVLSMRRSADPFRTRRPRTSTTLSLVIAQTRPLKKWNWPVPPTLSVDKAPARLLVGSPLSLFDS